MISVRDDNPKYSLKSESYEKVLAALVMVLGTGSSVVFAQEVNNSSAIVAEAQVPQDEFVKIDPTELPQAVMQTLAKDYEGASVKEAYVKETEETTLYKSSSSPKTVRKRKRF